MWPFHLCRGQGARLVSGQGGFPLSESREVARAAIRMALTRDHQEEQQVKEWLGAQGFRVAAVDWGGVFASAVAQVVERAVVAAKREGLIRPVHSEEGAVAGAAHEAVMAVAPKALGLNVGGKIGMARRGEHVVVALFCSVGLMHLDDVAIGLGHRAVAPWGEAAGR